MGLEEKYTDYEQKSFDEILAFKDQVVKANLPWATRPHFGCLASPPQEIIEIFLKKVYKRTK